MPSSFLVLWLHSCSTLPGLDVNDVVELSNNRSDNDPVSQALPALRAGRPEDRRAVLTGNALLISRGRGGIGSGCRAGPPETNNRSVDISCLKIRFGQPRQFALAPYDLLHFNERLRQVLEDFHLAALMRNRARRT